MYIFTNLLTINRMSATTENLLEHIKALQAALLVTSDPIQRERIEEDLAYFNKRLATSQQSLNESANLLKD